MVTVCEQDKCAACMACVEACGKNAIEIVDSLNAFNAVINADKCVDCGACRRVCQNLSQTQKYSPIKWLQGWANEMPVREKAASGGFASAISKAFVRNGGVVFGCVFREGQFVFEEALTETDALKFSGSKYVKSNPQGVYRSIKKYLIDGKKVLFIGLPCQVAAVKMFMGEKLSENLYTVDLICHGTPSPKNLTAFLKEHGADVKTLSSIVFRDQTSYRLSYDGIEAAPKGVLDRYSMAFINSLDLTENCYSCQYAGTERASDLTLGDSWGSELPEEEKRRGISLAMVMTEKGKSLIESADLHIEDVDAEKAIANNRQLQKPSAMPESRNSFFKSFKNGGSFQKAVKKALPKQCVKQDLKAALCKIKK